MNIIKDRKDKLRVEEINKEIGGFCSENTNMVSDGYHTFGELYDHRIALFILLVRLSSDYKWTKSYLHHDLTKYDGWFIVTGYIDNNVDAQVSYHLPNKYWDDVDCVEVSKAPKRDGHESSDAITRLLAGGNCIF